MIEWRGDDYQRRLVQHVAGNLDAAATVVESSIIRSFGDSGVKNTRSGATKAQRASNRSKPGEPPHVDTGRLKNSIAWKRQTLLLRRIGSGIGGKKDPGYAFYLEFGTRRMAARPYLRPALTRERERVRKIISRPLST